MKHTRVSIALYMPCVHIHIHMLSYKVSVSYKAMICYFVSFVVVACEDSPKTGESIYIPAQNS